MINLRLKKKKKQVEYINENKIFVCQDFVMIKRIKKREPSEK